MISHLIPSPQRYPLKRGKKKSNQRWVGIPEGLQISVSPIFRVWKTTYISPIHELSLCVRQMLLRLEGQGILLQFRGDGPRLQEGPGSSLQTKGLSSPKAAVLVSTVWAQNSASYCGGREDTASSSPRDLWFSLGSGSRISP